MSISEENLDGTGNESHKMNVMFDHKNRTNRAEELTRINELNSMSKEDPDVMLELSDIAYQQQLRKQSVNEGE